VSLVTAYQRRWPGDFIRIRDYVLTQVSTYESIEHIGSTSIPGMVAKPIIDIVMVVPDGEMNRTIEELARLEYRHQGDLGVPGREAFDYLPPHIDLPKHHLYACYPSNPQIVGSLAFREFLRENRDWKERLSDLKTELDLKHGSDRKKYMEGKRELVEEIIRIAKERCF